jgi:hypothetical protein
VRNLKQELVVFQDMPTGETGFRLNGARVSEEMFAATTGQLIAHDIIEHVNGAGRIGDIDDELEALGAIWYTRGRWHDLNRNGAGSFYTPEQNVASDVADMLLKVLDGEPMPECKRTTALDCDDSLREICDHGLKTARDEWPHRSNPGQAFPIAEARRYLRAALGLMRTGYRKAARKYDNASTSANSAFWEIARAVDQAIKGGDLFEGARYMLTYNWETGRAFCEPIYEEEY